MDAHNLRNSPAIKLNITLMPMVMAKTARACKEGCQAPYYQALYSRHVTPSLLPWEREHDGIKRGKVFLRK